VKRIEHIGIAVRDIESSNKLFAKILGTKSYKSEVVDTQAVVTSFFKIGESKIELIASLNNESVISKYLEKNKEGMHHIAFYVDDVNAEIKRLKKEGIRVINETLLRGADNKMICFLHPKDTNGVLIELCQEAE
tara:strand:- start:939 stop:1340 length:402 start_codon:yes stop_codon:yes gene_type:complete